MPVLPLLSAAFGLLDTACERGQFLLLLAQLFRRVGQFLLRRSLVRGQSPASRFLTHDTLLQRLDRLLQVGCFLLHRRVALAQGLLPPLHLVQTGGGRRDLLA